MLNTQLARALMFIVTRHVSPDTHVWADHAGAGGQAGDAPVVIPQPVPALTAGQAAHAAVEVGGGQAALLAAGAAVQARHPRMAPSHPRPHPRVAGAGGGATV